MIETPASSPRLSRLLTRPDLINGTLAWLVTNAVVLGAGFFGWSFVTPPGRNAETLLGAYANWDGGWYSAVADSGYVFQPGRQSSPAFFPAYPFMGRAVAWATGCPTKVALFAVAQFFLLASFVLFHSYVRFRYPDHGRQFPPLVLMAFGVFPATFFYHMAYTESLFMFVVLTFLYAVERRAPLLVLALIAGFATATRGAGLGLVPAVMAAAWFRRGSFVGFLANCVWLVPISVWGIVAYCAHLNAVVGDPLAFMKAQEGWNMHPGAPLTEKLTALVTFQPVWASFIPGSGFYFPADRDGRFSTSAINAVVFVLAIALVLIGVWRRWLTAAEFLSSAGMLGVTYLSKAFDSNMLSFARYASATPPMYAVLALLLTRLPAFATYAYLLICAWITVMVTALFTAGFHVI